MSVSIDIRCDEPASLDIRHKLLALGNAVIVNAVFVDDDNVPTDPTAVRVRLRRRDGGPSGEQAFTYGSDDELTKIKIGHYRFRYAPALYGAYAVRFEGTGALAAAVEDVFNVSRSMLGGKIIAPWSIESTLVIGVPTVG